MNSSLSEKNPSLQGTEIRRRRRRYFARRIVYAWERPSIMRKHIYTGAMGNI